ncbi:hypothetical protein EV715DRAFT_269202 [Schizophyllum commune]
MAAAEIDRSMPLTSSVLRIRAIPTSLFFLVPLIAIALVLFSLSQSWKPGKPDLTAMGGRHPAIASVYASRYSRRRLRVCVAWASFAILVLTAILIGALGATSSQTYDPRTTLAGEVLICLSQFELGAVFLYLTVVSSSKEAISPFKLYTCAFILTLMMMGANLVSILSLFLAMPPLLPVTLVFVFLALALPFPAYQLAWTIMVHRGRASKGHGIIFSPACSTTSTLTACSASCKDAYSTPDLGYPASAGSCGAPAQSNATYTRIRNLWVYLFCAVLAASFAAASDIGAVSIISADDTASRTPFRIIEATGMVLCFICLTTALMVHTLVIQDEFNEEAAAAANSINDDLYTRRPVSRSSSFTSPRPRRNPIRRFMTTASTYCSAANTPIDASPRLPCPVHVETSKEICRAVTPTPSEDCTALRDPFAPVLTSSPAIQPDYESYPLTDASRLSAWGSLPMIAPPPAAAVTIVQPRKMPPTLRAKKSFANAGEGEQAEQSAFDLEEALLAQRLLRTLQVDEKLAASGPSSWLDSLGRVGSLGRRPKSPDF